MELDRTGDAGAHVLVLPGIPSHRSHFDGLIGLLSPKHRVLYPRLPGHPGAASGPFDFDAIISGLTEWFERNGVDRVVVIGHSAGAYMAVKLALSDPRVAGMIWLAPYLGSDDAGREQYRQTAEAVRAGADISDALTSQAYAPEFLARHPARAAETRSWISAMGAARFAEQLDALARAVDLRPRLGEIEIPIHLRVGTKDGITPATYCEAIRDRCRRCDLSIAEGAGHMLLAEDFDATSRTVLEVVDATS